MVGLLVFLLILGFMVLIHEAGHFVAAKLCGVRVEAFAIGFGKRLFGVVHKGTDYRVNILPLGGYVKMAGQDEMPSALEQTIATPDGNEPAMAAETVRQDRELGHGVELTAVTRWQRMLIGFAGPVSNFALAIVLLLFANLFHYERAEFLQGAAVLDYVPANSSAARAGLKPGDTVVRINDHDTSNWQSVFEQTGVAMRTTVPITYLHAGQRLTGSMYVDPVEDVDGLADKIGLIPREQQQPIGVREVQGGTPAAKAGLLGGDRIVAIDGMRLHSVVALLSYLQDGAGRPVTLTVQRGNTTPILQVTPEIGMVNGDRRQYRLGFRPEPPPYQVVKLPFGEALKQSWKDNAHYSLLIVQILRGLFTNHVSMKNMSGPVGIEQQVSESAKQGFWEVVKTTAAISLNVGIFNLLPMPILDGGLILFLIIESIARRDVKPVIKERIYQAAFVCIIVFFCFVMWNDISRLIFAHRPG